MKKISLFSLLLVVFVAANAQYKLIRKWETDTILKVPESVLLDNKTGQLYVSNVDGKDPWGKDGKGSIGKIGLDGKIIASEWVTGLNAPKGMGLVNNKLYVADVDRVAVIDTTDKRIIQNISIDGALNLNDITIGEDGAVYVSDSETKKVHKIQNGVVITILENLERPNGLLMHKGVLFVLDNGKLYKVESGNKILITEGLEGGTDGIENFEGNDFIVSCWWGVIYHVNTDGKKELLLDSRKEKINTADIALDPKKKILYVPTFWKNSIVAYEIVY